MKTKKISARTIRAIDKTGLLSERRMQVFTALCRDGASTSSEVAASLGEPRDSVSPRIAELSRMGIVRECGYDICSVTGRAVKRWEAINAMPSKIKRAKSKVWFLVKNRSANDPVAFSSKDDATRYANRVKSTVFEAVERKR